MFVFVNLDYERICTNLRFETECDGHFVKLTVPRSNQWSVGKFGQVLVTAAAATNHVNHVLPISGGLSAFPGLDDLRTKEISKEYMYLMKSWLLWSGLQIP